MTEYGEIWINIQAAAQVQDHTAELTEVMEYITEDLERGVNENTDSVLAEHFPYLRFESFIES
jgi:hypothetical protein